MINPWIKPSLEDILLLLVNLDLVLDNRHSLTDEFTTIVEYKFWLLLFVLFNL